MATTLKLLARSAARLPGARRLHSTRHCLHASPLPRRKPFQPPRAAAAAAATPELAAAASQPHISVLLEEIMGFFQDRPVGVYVDGTLGAGGHASEVLRRHPELTTIVGFDLDPTAHSIATERLQHGGARVIPVSLDSDDQVCWNGAETAGNAGSPATTQPMAFLVRGNFATMGPVLPQLPGCGAGTVDAMLLDLGMSSMQVDGSDRGFSFIRDGPLDMRMDPNASLSAEEVVNTWSEMQLGVVIRDLGEERFWKGVARRIVAAREEAPILTTQALVKAIGTPGGKYSGGRSGGNAKFKHPATRTFQALRIAVNGELQSIAEALPAAVDALAPGGRLAVITFHSLEDRIVKWAFRQEAGMAPSDERLPAYCIPFDPAAPPQPARVTILTRRPVVPSEAEQKENPRSRSAKLRVVERL